MSEQAPRIRELGRAIRSRREAEDRVIAIEGWYSLPEGVLRVRYEALLAARRHEAKAFSALEQTHE